MTALCGGGTSQPKPALDAFVTYSAGAIALALQARGAAKLIPLIPLLGLAPLELSAFCGTDPPALPTLTEDEVFSLLLFRLDGDYFSGLGKFRDLVSRILWYELCDCTTGSPTAFVNPTLPTNTPDPIAPAVPGGSPCATLGPLTYGAINGQGTFNRGGIIIPRSLQPTLARLTIKNELVSGAGFSVQHQARFERGTVDIVLDVITTALGTTTVSDYAIPQDNISTEFDVSTVPVGGSGEVLQTITWEIYCGGQTPGVQTPCCPPDQATQAYLDQILAMVTLIQRQAVPFSYVYGANHTALSGHGSFAVSGLIGVSVDVTTLPASYGSRDGSPVELFDLGFVTLGTADGYEVSRRVDHDGTLMLPPLGGAFTAVGYSLSPGIVVSIRELVREP